MERPFKSLRPLGPFMQMGSGSKSQHVRVHLEQSNGVSEEALKGIVAMIGESQLPYDVTMGDVFTEVRGSSGVVHVVTGADELSLSEIDKITEFVHNASQSRPLEVYVNYH
jgi:hypothetical protein